MDDLTRRMAEVYSKLPLDSQARLLLLGRVLLDKGGKLYSEVQTALMARDYVEVDRLLDDLLKSG